MSIKYLQLDFEPLIDFADGLYCVVEFYCNNCIDGQFEFNFI